MRLQFFLLPILLSLSFSPSSATFFPNITSLPNPKDLLPNATASAWDAFHKFAGCRAGQRLDGLAKLKQYFNYFGYIPPSPSNYTDDFDNALEAAVKAYQKNFNLQVTGEMDEQTLKQISLPRCGNADIVNGSTTMNSGKTTSFNFTTTQHFHTVGHYSYFPGMPRWTKQELTYAFLPENQLTDEVKGVFSRAFDRWATVIPMTFTQTDSIYTADIRIGFYSGDHGDGEPFDGVLGTLAHSFSPPSGRFHLDSDENWVVSGDIGSSTLTSAVDLESVAVHEIGHLLGLGHSSDEAAIMYPTIPSRTRKVELANDDVDGVQRLYGSNPNYNGTTTPSVRQRESSGSQGHGQYTTSGWSLGVLMAFGFVLLRL